MKPTLDQILHLENDETIAADERDVLPVPTVDDRANIFLNAVYGAREFTDAEYTRTRNALLDEMASNVCGYHDSATADESAGISATGDASRPRLFGNFESRIAQYEEDSEFKPDPLHREALSEHASIRRSSSSRAEATKVTLAAIASAVEIEDRTTSARRSRSALEPLFSMPDEAPSSAQPRRRRPQREFVRLKSAALGGLVTLAIAAAALLPFIWPIITNTPSKPDIVAQFRNDGQSARGAPKSKQVRDLDLNDRLVALGDRLLADGDLYGGRLVLMEAAGEGSATAAIRMGATFDPIEIHPSWKTTADPAKARSWYLRARELGSPEAQTRIDRLGR